MGPFFRQLSHAAAAAARDAYVKQGGLVVLNDFFAPAFVESLADSVRAAGLPKARVRIPGVRSAASTGAQSIRRALPSLRAFYESPALISFLSNLVGRELGVCPDWDDHAHPLYYYEEPGDFIAPHKDKSFYRGGRFTALVGLVDESTSELVCRHAGPAGPREARVRTTPGSLVLFDGDRILHSVSPLGKGECRIVLSLQYVDDARISVLGKFIHGWKDRLIYFRNTGR